MKNEIVVKQSSKLSLEKSKSLIGITSKILPKNVDYSWEDRLWKWADENGIREDKIPRDIESLTQLTELNMRDSQLLELPKEIGNLTKLEKLCLRNNNLTKFPKELAKLRRLTFIG